MVQYRIGWVSNRGQLLVGMQMLVLVPGVHVPVIGIYIQDTHTHCYLSTTIHFPVLLLPLGLVPYYRIDTQQGGYSMVGRVLVGIGPQDTMVPIGTYTLRVNTQGNYLYLLPYWIHTHTIPSTTSSIPTQGYPPLPSYTSIQLLEYGEYWFLRD